MLQFIMHLCTDLASEFDRWQHRIATDAIAVGSKMRSWLASRRCFSHTSWSRSSRDLPAWSEEWKQLGFGATLVDGPAFPRHLFFTQLGFGVDQHGSDDATKAAIRAVRNAVEFNSIPGVITHLPGGRSEMLVHVKLGVPSLNGEQLPVDALQVAKVFPYGKLLPFEVVPGGLSFHTGRIVEELGDNHDEGICVAACVSIGHGEDDEEGHVTYSTKDGY